MRMLGSRIGLGSRSWGCTIALAAALAGSLVPAAAGAQWQWQNPLPQGNWLAGAWGTGPTSVYAVGHGGTVLHYNGSAWSILRQNTADYLWDIWGTGPTDIWVVGARDG